MEIHGLFSRNIWCLKQKHLKTKHIKIQTITSVDENVEKLVEPVHIADGNTFHKQGSHFENSLEVFQNVGNIVTS